MRQIKFRAWDKENNRFFVPTYEAYKGNLSDLLIGLSGDLFLHTMQGTKHESLFPERFELMQFIGLCDCNDREIYEGDIIKTTGYVGVVKYEHQTAQYQIIWKDNANRYMPFNVTFSDGDIWKCDYMEVIGNIYTNPELLK